MRREVQWRPTLTVASVAEVEPAVEAMRNGELYSMFIPDGSELKLAMSEQEVPDIIRCAHDVGLLTEMIKAKPTPLIMRKGRKSDFGPHTDTDNRGNIVVHEGVVGRTMALFMRPTADYIWRKSFNNRSNWMANPVHKTHILEELLTGYIDETVGIEPIVEVALQGPGDLITFLESPAVDADVVALPVPHWFLSLTTPRESLISRYGSGS